MGQMEGGKESEVRPEKNLKKRETMLGRLASLQTLQQDRERGTVMSQIFNI